MSERKPGGATEEHRKNRYEAQRAWADHVYRELSDAEIEQTGEDLEQVVGERHEADRAEEEQ